MEMANAQMANLTNLWRKTHMDGHGPKPPLAKIAKEKKKKEKELVVAVKVEMVVTSWTTTTLIATSVLSITKLCSASEGGLGWGQFGDFHFSEAAKLHQE